MTYLFLHGFTGGPEAWDAVRSFLPPKTAVICPELGGHGETEALPWDDEVSRILERLELEDAHEVHLVGYSFGGRLGWGALAQNSPRVIRATLIGAHPGLLDSAARIARQQADTQWVRMLRDQGIEAFADAWEKLPMWVSQQQVEPLRHQARRALRRRHPPRRLADALARLGLGEMPELDHQSIHVPITLISGSLDTKFERILSDLAPRLMNARHRSVAEAGHDVTLERPRELASLLQEPLIRAEAS